MHKLWNNILEKSRSYRSEKFRPLGEFCFKHGLTANVFTFISLLFGLAAVYFLFENRLLFILFAGLHLLADALDGIVARASTPTKFGKYFDYITDNLVVELLLLIKIWYYLQDYYVLIIVGVYLITNLLYLISKTEYPVLFSRTLILVILSFNFPTIAYLVAGVLAVYTLALQLQKLGKLFL